MEKHKFTEDNQVNATAVYDFLGCEKVDIVPKLYRFGTLDYTPARIYPALNWASPVYTPGYNVS